MSIEENEETAVRGLLGTAFAVAEPPLRDLASGSIARGDAARHRNRVLAAGGATLSVVAVIGTFALVTGATPAKHRNQTPANQVTSAATSASPSGPLAFGPEVVAVDKSQDIRVRLPALLQPLLPQGITAGQAPNVVIGPNRPATLLTGPSGTNQATMWVGSAPTRTDIIRDTACPPQGENCQTRAVDGGTVYIRQGSSTAADVVRAGGDYYPVDMLKAGTANTVAAKSLSVTYVPDDRTKYAFNFQVTTTTARLQLADHEPSDFPTGAQWPPVMPPSTDPSYDPSGLLMSVDDVVAMLDKPGLDKLENLLDPRTAVSKETQDKFAQTESQIVAVATPALPTGVEVGVDTSIAGLRMVVTGPTGKNVLSWQAADQTAKYKQQTFGWCPPNVTCSKRTVPGGTLLVWAEKPMDSKGTILDNTPSSYEYWFFPDDTSKQALTMTLGTDASQTGSPGRSVTEPGKSYSVADGPYVPVQVSADQFLAAAESGQLAAAIHTTASLIATLT